MAEPLVTVVIPTYNKAEYILEAMESVLVQDYPQGNIEIIVIDDGSTDETIKKLEKYTNKIKYIHQENSGKALAVRRGIEESSGEYIFNLDPDDKFIQGKIRKVVRVFVEDKEVLHVGHPVIYWQPDKGAERIEKLPAFISGKKRKGSEIIRFFMRNNCFFGGGSSFAGRADILKKIAIYKDMGFSVDAYMVYFLMSKGCSYYLDEPMSYYRITPDSYSSKEPNVRAEMDMSANKAISEEINKSGFDDDIKLLYKFKTDISELKFKEFSGEKTFRDILGLWRELFKNSNAINCSTLSLIKKYGLLQRSLPSSFAGIARKIKERI